MQSLAQGRMRMDYPCHVLKHGTHLKQSRKLTGQFSNVSTYCLNANDSVV